MWLFFPFGFISVVQKSSDPKGTLCLRARDAKSLDNLRVKLPALGPTIETFGTDYPFRAKVDAAAFGDFVGDYLATLMVENFKDSASAEHGDAYHDACFDVWHAMQGIAPRRAYAGRN